MSDTSALPKLLLRPREAADAMGVCEKTLWSLTSPRGPIPCVRLGTAVRYSPDALQRWIREQEGRP